MTNQQVIKHLNRIADVLSHIGYRFTNPTPIGEPATSELLSSFEKRFPMPSVLKDFYLHASHVDFTGLPPDTWTGCEYPDPIVILPIEDAVGELSDYDRDQQEYTRAFGGFRFPIAPDAFHKADVSGGMWYNIPFFPQPLPPDPIVSDIPYAVKTLSEYLTFALNWGGFPGLSKVDAHNWPLIDLTKGG